MAFFSIGGVRIAGVCGAVPQLEEAVASLDIFTSSEAAHFTATTGVRSRHVSAKLLASDLCTAAAKRMMDSLAWEPSTIDALVAVTQTPDHFRPSNAHLLHRCLGLSKECAAICISAGCSGWVYGLHSAASHIATGARRVLLCCGEGVTAYDPRDKSTYPLFGAAGTCTALEAVPAAAPMHFHLASDGAGWNAIRIPSGAYRDPSGERKAVEMDGMSVFSFGITEPPKSIKALLARHAIDPSSIDSLLLHQANLMLNAKIAKKSGFAPERCPHNIEDFGNSSSATIPLLMATRLKMPLETSRRKLLACAFGVGLSWGSVYFETDKIAVPDLVFVEDGYADVFA
ncbi:MAG: ketoacyl-ACP synthase III [Kiritimatiellae bacterium]|nr:ketoacyl-ACP synthase III [Kiritimatiellia bacterium]